MKNQLKTNAALPARYYETFEVKTVVPHARSTLIVVLSAKIKPTSLYYWCTVNCTSKCTLPCSWRLCCTMKRKETINRGTDKNGIKILDTRKDGRDEMRVDSGRNSRSSGRWPATNSSSFFIHRNLVVDWTGGGRRSTNRWRVLGDQVRVYFVGASNEFHVL